MPATPSPRPSPMPISSGRRLAQRRCAGIALRRNRAAARWRSRRNRRRSAMRAAGRCPRGVPTCMIRPSLKTATRSAIDSASPWSWVTKTKVMPSDFCSAFSSSCIFSRSFRSSAPSGSSSSSTFGLVDQRAGQRHALALAAGELARACARRSPAACTSASASSAALRALGLADALDHQPVGDVVEHVQVREQRVVLEHGVDVAPVGRHAFGASRRRSRYAPAVGCSKPAIRRRQVVLPEPDGPSMAKNSPGAMSRSTASTARTAPKWRETCRKETAGVMGMPRRLASALRNTPHPSPARHLLPQGEK